MTDNETPTIAPPPPADTIPPPPDYTNLVDSTLTRRTSHDGLADMVRKILAELLIEDSPKTQPSRP